MRRRLVIPAASAVSDRELQQRLRCSWMSRAIRTSTCSGLQTRARSRWPGQGQKEREGKEHEKARFLQCACVGVRARLQGREFYIYMQKKDTKTKSSRLKK